MTDKLTKFCLCLVTMLTLSACMAPKFVDPDWDANTTAKVRFVTHNTKGKNVMIYKYEGESCISGAKDIATLSGMAVNHNRKRLGLPLGENFDDKMLTESIIEAGSMSSFAMAYWGFGGRCNINFDFHPEAGEIYEISFDKTDEYCSATFYHITQDENGQYQRYQSSDAKVSVNNCRPGVIN